MQRHRGSSLFYYLFFVEHLRRQCVDNPFWALYENVLSLLSVSLWSLESFLRWIHRLYCLHHIWELIALLFQQSQSYPVRKKIKHQDTQNVVLRGGLQELLYHKMTILLLLLDELQWIVLEWKSVWNVTRLLVNGKDFRASDSSLVFLLRQLREKTGQG